MWSIQLQFKCFENSKQHGEADDGESTTCSEEAVNKQSRGQQKAGESEGEKYWSPPHELSGGRQTNTGV